MRRNLYAFTGNGPYPPYISINKEEDGRISLTARGEAKLIHGIFEPASAPSSATFYWTAEEWEKFKREIAVAK